LVLGRLRSDTGPLAGAISRKARRSSVKQVTLEFLFQNFFRASRNDTAVAGYLMRDTIFSGCNPVRQKGPDRDLHHTGLSSGLKWCLRK
jgi:hypothetical protein